jgi:hypothetical protein
MTTTVPDFSPTSGAWTDPRTGKLTAAAQIWLRGFKRAAVDTAADHGELTGLGDDDHLQYLTAARGALLFQPLDSDLTAIAALATTAYGRALLETVDAAALTALLNPATALLKGLAPASGGGTANFLRADMTWAAPPGGGGGGTGNGYFPQGWG